MFTVLTVNLLGCSAELENANRCLAVAKAACDAACGDRTNDACIDDISDSCHDTDTSIVERDDLNECIDGITRWRQEQRAVESACLGTLPWECQGVFSRFSLQGSWFGSGSGNGHTQTHDPDVEREMEDSHDTNDHTDRTDNDTVRCTNTCIYAFDGDCDDGGPGADYAFCDLGTDCADCGPR